MQHFGLCVFRLPIYLLTIVRIPIVGLNVIIKSGV